MRGKRSFLVGRRTGGAMVVVLVQHPAGPIQGPWTLEAVTAKPAA